MIRKSILRSTDFRFRLKIGAVLFASGHPKQKECGKDGD